MNNKHILYLASACALLGAATSCEQNDIYSPMEFAVRLAPQNTYVVGEPVTFDFEGNADFISVWTGDVGHEYRFRDRILAAEDFKSSTLSIDLSQQYGNPSLDIYLTDKFEGLKGREYGDANAHAPADRALIQNIIDTNFEGWERFAFDIKNEVKFHTFTADITKFKDNFTLAIRMKTPDGNKQGRTYMINPKITSEFEQQDTYTWKFNNLSFTPFRMSGLWMDKTPYICSTQEDTKDFLIVNQNGVVKFGNGANPIPGADIGFQSFVPGTAVNAALPGVNYEPTDQWIIMTPFKLYTVKKDSGTNIKGVTDEVHQYEYTYDKPGTYTTTFIVSKGNFQGESARELREVTFTVVDKIR